MKRGNRNQVEFVIENGVTGRLAAGGFFVAPFVIWAQVKCSNRYSCTRGGAQWTKTSMQS